MLLIMRPITPGLFFNDKKGLMEYSEIVAERASEITDSQRTEKVLSDIANSISNQIKVTVDSPERNPDQKMTVLDMKLWI